MKCFQDLFIMLKKNFWFRVTILPKSSHSQFRFFSRIYPKQVLNEIFVSNFFNLPNMFSWPLFHAEEEIYGARPPSSRFQEIIFFRIIMNLVWNHLDCIFSSLTFSLISKCFLGPLIVLMSNLMFLGHHLVDFLKFVFELKSTKLDLRTGEILGLRNPLDTVFFVFDKYACLDTCIFWESLFDCDIFFVDENIFLFILPSDWLHFETLL